MSPIKRTVSYVEVARERANDYAARVAKAIGPVSAVGTESVLTAVRNAYSTGYLTACANGASDAVVAANTIAARREKRRRHPQRNRGARV